MSVRRGHKTGAWCAKRNTKYQWFQVYFPKPKTVTACATQGRQDANQWVKSYYVTYSVDGINFVPYKKRGVTKVRIMIICWSARTRKVVGTRRIIRVIVWDGSAIN